jgi:hypothetical protein
LKDERELREYENKVLRKLFGCVREVAAGGLRKLYNQNIKNLYLLS